MVRPKVFISYTHDSDEHCDHVLKFVQFLNSCGISPIYDKWAQVTRKDWYPWARDGITGADYVLIIASDGYREMGDGSGPNDKNYGGRIEASLLREYLQRDRDQWTKKLLPVVLPGHTIAEIPDFLYPYSHDRYEVTSLTPDGAESLLRTITEQPAHVRPPLGPLVRLPPKSGPGSKKWRGDDHGVQRTP